MIHHDRSAVLAAGYQHIEDSADMPGIGRLQKIARRDNWPAAHLTAFRHGPDDWAIYAKPGAQRGYTSQPILPN